MTTPFDAEVALLPAGGWTGALADAAVKGILLLALAAVAARLLRHASAAARHLAWTLGFAGVLALPLLGVLVPQWQVRVLPASWFPVEVYDDGAEPPPADPLPARSDVRFASQDIAPPPDAGASPAPMLAPPPEAP
ncbi:MAG TPA: hypothetical protein VHG91_00675, partial [Longimicrobium sp.]|nr:hypothetical protein [Longimicrobium sp.]